ncbi:hypothetical protein EVAR_24781_1 [Eumeta japonica]|uniref:Uncharacterized protein n=1 Tax=Eumeta variegata TaxID=151549 RepID=A0A4C1W0P6_EUMVA|nr:hypothetical protein EVAR_24781_1 [Eumeta japonica]
MESTCDLISPKVTGCSSATLKVACGSRASLRSRNRLISKQQRIERWISTRVEFNRQLHANARSVNPSHCHRTGEDGRRQPSTSNTLRLQVQALYLIYKDRGMDDGINGSRGRRACAPRALHAAAGSRPPARRQAPVPGRPPTALDVLCRASCRAGFKKKNK